MREAGPYLLLQSSVAFLLVQEVYCRYRNHSFSVDQEILEIFLGDFQKLTEEKYLVEEHVNEAAIIIRNTKEPKLTLKVILTSPLIRDEAEKKEGGTQSVLTCF